jgi:hypothetical protein
MAARAEDRFGRRVMNVVPTGSSSLRAANHILTTRLMAAPSAPTIVVRRRPLGRSQ